MSEFKFQEYCADVHALGGGMQRISSKRSRARPEGTLAPYGQHVNGTGGPTPCISQ